MIKHSMSRNSSRLLSATHVDMNDLVVIADQIAAAKSSLLQALLLLAQTLENTRSDVVLNLGGRYIQFAEFREAVYGRPSNRVAEFGGGFTVDHQSPTLSAMLRSNQVRYSPSSSRGSFNEDLSSEESFDVTQGRHPHKNLELLYRVLQG